MVADGMWSNSAKRNFETISVSRNARFSGFRGKKKKSFITTEASEAGSLGARRTQKGWESCLRIKQPHEFHNAIDFF